MAAIRETILTDMADFVHWVTRLRLVKDSALMDGSRTEAEKTRGSEFAAKLTVPVLSRAWQMLLKGIQETASASNPMQAAEMVLIRLAHAVDMPPCRRIGADRQVRVHRSANVKPLPLRNDGGGASGHGWWWCGCARRRPRRGDQAAGPGAAGEPLLRRVSLLPSPILPGLVKFVGERRDVKLKGELERFVRPIAVS